jgi:thiamine-phosphate pyrophosphorylase
VRIFDAGALIYLITKGDLTAQNFPEKSVETLEIIEKAVAGGVSLIQIREKNLTAGKVFELAANAAKIVKNSNTRLLVNDRADIARAAGADGVHLPSDSLSAEIVRAAFGPQFIIGVSAHSLAEVAGAESDGADFATFGPIFATASKARYGPPQGLAKLREVTKTVENFSIVALGGIDENNYAEALNAGAKGIAAIRFLNDAKNLGEIVQRVRSHKNE